MATAKLLQDLLALKTVPVAITFRESAPANVPHIASAGPAGCSYWKRAAEGQTSYTEAADHYNCPIGAYTHCVKPADVLAESKPLPPLSRGDVLAFPNAGAYGLTASPTLFHGHPAPAEVAFAGAKMELIGRRQSASSLLEAQNRLRQLGSSTHP